jgi:mRNA interferase MazF
MHKAPTIGTIVLAHFPFTDLTSTKHRPAVVVAHAHGGDLVVAYISSQLRYSTPYTVLLSQEESGFLHTGLHVSSVVCVDKLATLAAHIVTGKLGTVSKKNLGAIKAKLRHLFRV